MARRINNRINVDSISYKRVSHTKDDFETIISIPHPKTSTYRKLTSSFLVFTMLFQLIAGVFLYSPASNVEASYSDFWYNTAWSYRKPITLDRTDVPHTDTNNTNNYLTDFPVLISTIDNDLIFTLDGKVKKEDGSDIIFTLPDKTPLNYEIESYDKTTGKLTAWVKIPQLNDANNTQDTVIYMYYGNASASANTTANIQGVWDTSFKMVQHMEESGTNPAISDSTSNASNSVSATWTPSIGQIGGGGSFNGSQYIDIGSKTNLQSTTQKTMEFWMLNPNAESTTGAFLGYLNVFEVTPWLSTNMRTILNTSVAGLRAIYPAVSTTQNVWQHIAVSYDSSVNTLKIYKNGILVITDTTTFNGTIALNNTSFWIARSGNGLTYFTGSLDEVRISNTARSADWIKTEYNNQSDPSSFYTTSPQESYLDHYLITGNNTQESGESQTLTLTAFTYSGDTYTAYTGDKTITLTGANPYLSNHPTFTDKNGNETDFGSYATVSFTNGIAHTNITLYKAETANIIATDGYCNNTPSLQVSVPNNSAFIPPSKPSLANVNITMDNGHLTFTNLPTTITQIAISTSPDFTNSSWEDISKKDDLLKQYDNTDTLYIKFRTQEGGVSDTIIKEGNNIAKDKQEVVQDNTDTDTNNSNQSLQDGDIVKTSSSPDIYVIKYKNNKQYKRLLLSPTIFNFYLHLKWSNIKTISQQQLDQYQTSNLVKEATDTVIYILTSNGDTGKRKPLNPSTSYDPDSIYEINKPERDSYELED